MKPVYTLKPIPALACIWGALLLGYWLLPRDLFAQFLAVALLLLTVLYARHLLRGGRPND